MENIITSSVTVSELPSNKGTQFKNPNDISFEVKYSEDYAGAKHWPVGKVLTVSKEVAEDFTKRGIGSVVTEETTQANPEPVAVTSDTTETVLTVSKEVAEDKGGKKGKK